MSGDQLINSIIYRDWMQCQLVPLIWLASCNKHNYDIYFVLLHQYFRRTAPQHGTIFIRITVVYIELIKKFFWAEKL